MGSFTPLREREGESLKNEGAFEWGLMCKWESKMWGLGKEIDKAWFSNLGNRPG